MFEQLDNLFEQHPESLDSAPKLAYTANRIIGEYYRKTALYLGIPEYIIEDARNDEYPEKQSKKYWNWS
jgi:hypothetical protein